MEAVIFVEFSAFPIPSMMSLTDTPGFRQRTRFCVAGLQDPIVHLTQDILGEPDDRCHALPKGNILPALV